MKTFKFLSLAFLSLTLFSCDNDSADFEPISISPPAINPDSNFAVGPTVYNVTAAIGNRVSVDGKVGYRLVFVGGGITAINGMLNGTGDVVQLILYKDDFTTDLAGTYVINETQENFTSALSYATDYNTATTSDANDDLLSGTVVVETLLNNEIRVIIEDGITEETAQEFTLFFEGGVLFFN